MLIGLRPCEKLWDLIDFCWQTPLNTYWLEKLPFKLLIYLCCIELCKCTKIAFNPISCYVLDLSKPDYLVPFKLVHARRIVQNCTVLTLTTFFATHHSIWSPRRSCISVPCAQFSLLRRWFAATCYEIAYDHEMTYPLWWLYAHVLF